MDIKVKRLHNSLTNLPLPAYATAGAAGMDLRAAIQEDTCLYLYPGKIMIVPCGISVEIPQGYEFQIRPRSGLASKFGITVVNSPGTIDSDYRGEIKVALINLGNLPYVILPNDRIAQIVLAKVEQVTFTEVSELSETTRGGGGIGSTGVE